MVEIISLIRDSFQEYEPYHSIVLFVKGCNLHCKKCYNYYNVTTKDSIGSSIELLEENLNSMHEAIVFLGGEPTIWESNLIKDLKCIKSRWPKRKIKIYTNGMMPDVIKVISKNNLVDAYSVDVKSVSKSIKDIIGSRITIDTYLERIEKSIKYIQMHNIDIEIRTTNFDFIDIKEIKNYVANKFPNINHIIQDPFCRK